MSNNRRVPSPVERQVAERINKVWQRKKRELKLTQENAARSVGWSQATFNHYLNGRRPITVEVALLFAKILKEPALSLAPEILSRFEGAFTHHPDPMLIRYHEASPDKQALVDEVLGFNDRDLAALHEASLAAGATHQSMASVIKEGTATYYTEADLINDEEVLRLIHRLPNSAIAPLMQLIRSWPVDAE